MQVRWESTRLATHGGSTATGLLIGVGLTGVVAFAVTVLMGEQAPDGAWTVAWIGLAFSAVMGVLAYLAWQRAKASVRAGWDGDAIVLEIAGPEGRETYRGPFRAIHGWYRDAVHTGYGTIPQKVVQLVVLDDAGRPILSLMERLGAIHEAPAGWPERMISLSTPCPHAYVNSIGRLELDRLRDALSVRE